MTEHPFDRALRYLGLFLCAAITVFTIYTILRGQFSAQMQRGVFLLAAGVALFCLKPFSRSWQESGTPLWMWLNRAITVAVIGLMTFAVGYLFLFYYDIAASRQSLPNTWDLICYGTGTLAVLEGVRRSDGWPLLSVILVVLVYVCFGHLLPGFLGHHRIGVSELLELSFGMDGVFGIALATVANIIYIFIIFGAILRLTGAGQLFIDLSYMLTGRYPGGPAQCAVVASALFGSINGSGPANVVATGSFTIPLMKRSGYKPEFAGAVEAAASTVGQVMPPIMGVGAFIMSEITGIPYNEIMIAAIFPALLYSFSLLVNVRLRAQLRQLPVADRERIPTLSASMILRTLVMLSSIGAIVVMILTGRTPAFAGLAGIVTLFAAAFLLPEMRPDWRTIRSMLIEGGKDGLAVTVSCAGIGIIIGGISATGLGVKFSQAIISIGEGNLFLALVMAAACCLVIGMGLPTAASYLMVVYIAAPAVTQLGLTVLTAHLFIFYYACMSAITPPVAVCAYAGAGISGGDPFKTGIWAVRLGAVGFVLPFLWVYNPELLLSGSGVLETLWTLLNCTLAVVIYAAANIGFLRRRLRLWERGVLLAAAIGLSSHLAAYRAVGLVLGGAVLLLALRERAVSEKIPAEGGT
jgi:TRAP transporter 4TM/12TM fusion protein